MYMYFITGLQKDYYYWDGDDSDFDPNYKSEADLTK